MLLYQSVCQVGISLVFESISCGNYVRNDIISMLDIASGLDCYIEKEKKIGRERARKHEWRALTRYNL